MVYFYRSLKRKTDTVVSGFRKREITPKMYFFDKKKIHSIRFIADLNSATIIFREKIAFNAFNKNMQYFYMNFLCSISKIIPFRHNCKIS